MCWPSALPRTWQMASAAAELPAATPRSSTGGCSAWIQHPECRHSAQRAAQGSFSTLGSQLVLLPPGPCPEIPSTCAKAEQGNDTAHRGDGHTCAPSPTCTKDCHHSEVLPVSARELGRKGTAQWRKNTRSICQGDEEDLIILYIRGYLLRCLLKDQCCNAFMYAACEKGESGLYKHSPTSPHLI